MNGNPGSGGGGGRAAICVGLSDDKMLNLFNTHATGSVTMTPLAEVIGARFSAAGGPAGSTSYSTGTAGSGVYIQTLPPGTLMLLH